MPPMVGVPLLLACPAAASSSWISWPTPRLTKMRIATGVPSSAIAIDTEADSKRVLKDPPRCRAEPSYPGPYRRIQPQMSIRAGPPVPVLRVYAQVSRSEAVLHPSEHSGDGSQHGVVRIPVRDITSLCEELPARTPGSLPAGRLGRAVASPQARWLLNPAHRGNLRAGASGRGQRVPRRCAGRADDGLRRGHQLIIHVPACRQPLSLVMWC